MLSRAISCGVLEFEANADLGMARRTESAGDLAELRVADRGVGRSKARRVGKIEEFSAQLKLHAFANREFLAEGKIGIVDAVTAKIGEVAWRIPRDLIARIAEARFVEDRQSGCGSLMV